MQYTQISRENRKREMEECERVYVRIVIILKSKCDATEEGGKLFKMSSMMRSHDYRVLLLCIFSLRK